MKFANWLDTNVLTDEAARLAQLKRQVTSQISELSQRRDILSGEVAGFDKLIGQLQKTRNEHLTELAALDRKVSINRELSTQAQAELDALTTAIESARATVAALENEAAVLRATVTTIEHEIAALEQHHATLQATTPAIEATQAQAQAQALAAARAELARIVAATEAAREQLTLAQDDRETLKQNAIAEAEAEICLARRQFELETAIAIQNVEASKFEALKEIQSSELGVVERWREALTEPLQAELDAAQVEIGRLARLLAAKAGDSLEWQIEQVKGLLVRSLEDNTVRPNHLRIAGESESGKSHLVNQLITDGVTAMGLGAVDVELYDPYPSDTTWKIAPTIADDPEAVIERLAQWREVCESDTPAKRPKPLVIVLDEADELIRQFKDAATDSIKAILKRGRHCNLIIWLLGQNANVVKGMDWSDLRGAGAIYLNQCGYEYLKNGMKGRNCTAIQGELDAIASRYPYYALIHPKGAPRPYAVAVPKVLFPTTAKAATEAATEAQGIAQGVGKVACPKCGSDRTKSNGKALEGKRRIYCNNCGKSSTVSA